MSARLLSHRCCENLAVVCLYCRSAAVELCRPPLPHCHAQCLAGHLRATKSPRSSEKPAVVPQDAAASFSTAAVVGPDSAASDDDQSVTEATALVADKPVSVDRVESPTLPESCSARPTNDSVVELQRKKDALRLAFPCCLVSCLQCFDAVGWASGRASGL